MKNGLDIKFRKYKKQWFIFADFSKKDLFKKRVFYWLMLAVVLHL